MSAHAEGQYWVLWLEWLLVEQEDPGSILALSKSKGYSQPAKKARSGGKTNFMLPNSATFFKMSINFFYFLRCNNKTRLPNEGSKPR